MRILFDDRRLLADEPMARHTTVKIGGSADYLADPQNEEELAALLSEAREAGLPVTVIGKGSNLIVRDGGIRGLVVRVAKPFSGVMIEGNTVTALAGTPMASLAASAAEAGLSGLEFISGIPGSVGGGVYMNAGAYGGEIKDTATRVRVMDRAGEIASYTRDQMCFTYRYSMLMQTNEVITRVIFTLCPAEKRSIFLKMEDLNTRRREKQPLNECSCGSVFKRPVGHYAGELIERCGLSGYRIGQCEVSKKHAGFLVNTGTGTASDFLSLMDFIQQRVFDMTGVRLEPEITVLGSDKG